MSSNKYKDGNRYFAKQDLTDFILVNASTNIYYACVTVGPLIYIKEKKTKYYMAFILFNNTRKARNTLLIKIQKSILIGFIYL